MSSLTKSFSSPAVNSMRMSRSGMCFCIAGQISMNNVLPVLQLIMTPLYFWLFARARSQHNSIGCCRSLVHDVAGVACLCRLKHQDLGFGVSHCAMLHTSRDDTQLSGL